MLGSPYCSPDSPRAWGSRSRLLPRHGVARADSPRAWGSRTCFNLSVNPILPRFPARVEQPAGIRRQGRAEPQIPRAREEVEMMAERSVKKKLANSQRVWGSRGGRGATRCRLYNASAWGSRRHLSVPNYCPAQLPRVRGAVAVSDRHAGSATRKLPRVRGAVARRPAAPARRSGNSPVLRGADRR